MNVFAIQATPDRVLRIQANSPEEAAQGARNVLMREKGAAAGESGGVDNFGRSLARGASFGLADEFAAGADATVGPAVDWALGKVGLGSSGTSAAPDWSKRYEENLSRERGQDKAYDASSPVLSTAGKVTGAVGGALATLPRWLMAGGIGAAPATIARGAATGATLGGFAGFNEGEGGFNERLKSAGTGAVAGTVLGGAAPPVLGALAVPARMVAESGFGRAVADKVIAPGFRVAADALDALAPKVGFKTLSAAAPDGGMSPSGPLSDAADYFRMSAPSGQSILDNAAARRIADATQRGGVDVPAMGNRMGELGQDAMMLDAGNPMVQRLGRTAFITPGSAPKIIEDALVARNRQTGNRLVSAFEGDEPPPTSFALRGEGQAFDQNKRAVGAAAYADMKDTGLRQTPQLMALYENPAVKSAMDTVLAAEKAARVGRPNAVPASPVEIMHMVKREIDGLGFDKMTGRPLSTQQKWRDLSTDFVRTFKSANPAAAEADAAYRQAASLPEHFDAGRSFLLGGSTEAATEASAPALADMLATANTQQALAARAGSTNAARERALEGTIPARALARRIDGSDPVQAKLTELYGPERAQKIIQRASAEGVYAKTDKTIAGGSDTASKLLSVMDDAASGDLPTSANSLVSRILGKAADTYNKQRAGNEAVRSRIAQMLTETDTVANADTLDRIARILGEQNSRARGIQRGGAVAIGERK